MALTGALNSIKTALPFGTVKLNDDKSEFKAKGLVNSAIAWLKGAVNERSANNNETVKTKFRAQLVESFKSDLSISKLTPHSWEKIDKALKMNKPWAPLSVRTAKSVIRLATKLDGLKAANQFTAFERFKTGLATFANLFVAVDKKKASSFIIPDNNSSAKPGVTPKEYEGWATKHDLDENRPISGIID